MSGSRPPGDRPAGPATGAALGPAAGPAPGAGAAHRPSAPTATPADRTPDLPPAVLAPVLRPATLSPSHPPADPGAGHPTPDPAAGEPPAGPGPTADAPTPLGALIAGRIARTGPMRIDDFMRLCLLHPQHGYYATRDPFGAQGDFTTAPEISQMFGELVGLALAQAWLDQGSPAPFTLAELGPGRGTLMADLLRATRGVPGFHAAARVTLVEASAHLRGVQRQRLGDVAHLDHADDLPQAPLFLIANEFFDALPIRQFQAGPAGWSERLVTLDATGTGLALALGAPGRLPLADRPGPPPAPGEIRETCAEALPVIAAVAGRIARHGGAAIVVDYGTWDGRGDSLQALRAHAPDPVLAHPGAADLTAHVDFAPLAAAALQAGAAVSAPVAQGPWLEMLGIGARAARLAAAGDAGAEAARRRLTDAAQMGQLFKAMAIWPRQAPPSPGFGPLPLRPRPASGGTEPPPRDAESPDPT